MIESQEAKAVAAMKRIIERTARRTAYRIAGTMGRGDGGGCGGMGEICSLYRVLCGMDKGKAPIVW